MERAIWQIMVRSQTLPFDSFADATEGQLLWVFINQECDYDERLRRIHTHCLPKFHRDTCEVCGEPIVDLSKLPEDLRNEVWRPGEDDVGVKEIKVERVDSFDTDGDEVTVEHDT